jgi:predicted Zn-dependent protease
MQKIIYLLLIVTFVTSCVTPTTQYPGMSKQEIEAERRYQQNLVNQKKITTQEKQMKKNIKHQGTLYSVAGKIMSAGADLCNQMGKAANGCVYEFELDKSKVINAYADGKKIVVTQGMMDFVKNDGNLAVVLGHEYAHNIMGHIKAKKQNMGVGTVLGSLVDSVASSQGVSTGGMFGDLGRYAGAYGYSKEFEQEADYVGLYITHLAGYDVDNAPEFWRSMSLRDEESINNGFTHPTNPERYIALGKTIREIKRKKESRQALLPNFGAR